MDLSDGLPYGASMEITAGTYDDLADCGLVVITAGVNQKPGETRLEPEDAPQPHTGSDAGPCGAQEDGGIPQDLNPASQDGDEPCEDREDLPDSQDQ